MTIREMKARRLAALNAMNGIKSKAEVDKRDVTSDELLEVQKLSSEANDLKAKIVDAEQAEKALAGVDSELADLAKPARETSSAQVKERVLEDPKRGFESLGDFAASVHAGNDKRLWAAAGTGLQQGVAADGGYLVPPAFGSEIWDGVNQAPDNLWSATDNYPVPVGFDSLTLPAVNETSRVDGSRAGGLRGYWKSELSLMTESKPAFREVKLEPQELYVYAFVSDKLLRNKPALQQFLSRKAADEITFKLSDAVVRGTGSGQPKGILTGTSGTSSSRVTVSKETGQAADSFVFENVIKMYARMPARLRAGAVWYINQDVEPQLLSLNKAVGTGGALVYLPAGGLSSAPYGMLMGRPIQPIEQCATVGDEGDVIFANLGLYATANRTGIDAASSIHLKFDYNQTAFRFLFEADGQPWLANYLTPYKGTNYQSPFVTLAERA